MSVVAHACKRKNNPWRFEKDKLPPVEELKYSSWSHKQSTNEPAVGSAMQLRKSHIELQKGECRPISPRRTPRCQTWVAFVPVKVTWCHCLQTNAAAPKVGKDKNVRMELIAGDFNKGWVVASIFCSTRELDGSGWRAMADMPRRLAMFVV